MRESGRKSSVIIEANDGITLPLHSDGGKDARICQAVFMYDRAQNDMRDALGFLLDHGVALDFALEVFDMPRQDFWTPTREELVAGGVVGR